VLDIWDDSGPRHLYFLLENHNVIELQYENLMSYLHNFIVWIRW